MGKRRRPPPPKGTDDGVDKFGGRSFSDIRNRVGSAPDSDSADEEDDTVLSLASNGDRRRSGGECDGSAAHKRARSRHQRELSRDSSAGRPCAGPNWSGWPSNSTNSMEEMMEDAGPAAPGPAGAEADVSPPASSSRARRTSTRQSSGHSTAIDSGGSAASASATRDPAETVNATASVRGKTPKARTTVTEDGTRIDILDYGEAPSSWQILSVENTQAAWNALRSLDRTKVQRDHANKKTFNPRKAVPKAVTDNAPLKTRWVAAKGKAGMHYLRYTIGEEAKALASGTVAAAAAAKNAAKQVQALAAFNDLPDVANDPRSVVHNLGAAPNPEDDGDSDGDGDTRKPATGRGVHMPPCTTVTLAGVKTKAWREQKFYDREAGAAQVDGQTKTAERRTAALKNIAIALRHLEHGNKYLASLGNGSSVTVALHDKDFGEPGGDGTHEERLTLFGNADTVVEVTSLVSACVRRNMADAAGAAQSSSEEASSAAEESPLDIDNSYSGFRWYEDNSRHVVERCHYQSTPQNSEDADVATAASPSTTRASMADVVEHASAAIRALQAQEGSPASSSNRTSFSSESMTLASMQNVE